MAVQLIVRRDSLPTRSPVRSHANSATAMYTGGNYDCVTLADAETRWTTFKQIIPHKGHVKSDDRDVT